jgi:UDP-N-acetylglucosamine 2-epimerase (non-hydrolysing)
LISKKKIMVVFGTRPEAIKMAPVIRVLQASSDFSVQICVTGQHREMLDQVLDVFGIIPDFDLNIMKPDQTLGELTARAMTALDRLMVEQKPDMVAVQGDTTTAFVGALAAFYHHIPVSHIEAGLRTFNLQSPWPEEANRAIVSKLADLHFSPTERARQHLLSEAVERSKIFVTGNTVVDALFMALDIVRQRPPEVPGLQIAFFEDLKYEGSDLILVTGHRRESFGPGFERICKALRRISERENVRIVYPLHLNPNVREPVIRMLGGLPNVFLIEPVSYLPFVRLMSESKLIVTDSGGVQEEAPSLGTPVLVIRETTERPEAVDAGTVKLVGTDEDSIVRETLRLLKDSEAYEAMSRAHNPYGDGLASRRIAKIWERFFSSGGYSL